MTEMQTALTLKIVNCADYYGICSKPCGDDLTYSDVYQFVKNLVHFVTVLSVDQTTECKLVSVVTLDPEMNMVVNTDSFWVQQYVWLQILDRAYVEVETPNGGPA